MDQKSCTNCGKPLYDKDWISKSGLCRECAEHQLDTNNKPKYVKIILISLSTMLVLAVALLVAPWHTSPTEWETIIDGIQYVGYVKDTDNAVFIMFTDDELNMNDSIKKKDI